MSTVFDHLNDSDRFLDNDRDRISDTGAVDPAVEAPSSPEAALRRVLGRLGTYTAHIITPMNLRPTSTALLSYDVQRVEVRVSTSSNHVVLVIAPNGDLAAEVFFLRSLVTKNLPVPRLIGHDLSCATAPFTYALESHVGGVSLGHLTDEPRARVAARQVGRTLRQAHQIAAPGFGKPTPTGRWRTRTWLDVLNSWLAQREFLNRVADMLQAEVIARLLAATLEHPTLACDRPAVLHGAVEPTRAIVTVGDNVQLEALVRPGEIVGGDPLFDLAHGLLPRHPAAFRQGLIEGYTGSRPFTPEQEQRLQRLRLLLWVADTLWNGHDVALERLPEDVTGALEALSP